MFSTSLSFARYYVSVSSGNWSDPLVWNAACNIPTLHASTNLTITNSNNFTATFTSPSSTSSITGVIVHCIARGTTDWIMTLQENSVDTVAISTLTFANRVTNGWTFFKFDNPYLVSTTTAGYYRFKLRTNAVDTGTAAADSGGTLISYLAIYDDNGVPDREDNVWILSPNNVGNLVVTLEGDRYAGNGAETAIYKSRSIGNAVSLNCGGVLSWDTVANSTLTVKGNVVCANDGELAMGTTTTVIPAGIIAKLRFNENGTTVNYGLSVLGFGKCKMQGASKSVWKTHLSTGIGTVESPLITMDEVNWDIGDEIVVTATSDSSNNYLETENMFILNKLNTTTYILATTLGGATAGFTYTHSTGAWVINIERNVIIESTASAVYAAYFTNQANGAGDMDIDWARFNYMGGGVTGKVGVQLAYGSGVYGDCDYTVSYNPLNSAFDITQTAIPETNTGLVAFTNAACHYSFIFALGMCNRTLEDCFALKRFLYGYYLAVASGNRFIRCYAIGINYNQTWYCAGYIIGTANNNYFSECEAHACRAQAIFIDSPVGLIFENCKFGTIGKNWSYDVYVSASKYYEITFINSYFGSNGLISGYSQSLVGAIVKFHGNNGAGNDHIWYTPEGIGRSTGTGLVDTTVRTADSLALRLNPMDDSIGFPWEFKILAKSNTAVYCVGFLQRNSVFSEGLVKVELCYPNSDIVADTYTMSTTTGTWEAFTVSFNNTLSVDAYSKVKITAISNTAGAYLYVDDIYNGGNKITSLDTWDNGQPSSIMFDQLGDVMAFWVTPKTLMNITGSMGKEIVDIGTYSLHASTSATSIENKVDKIDIKTDDNSALIMGK